MRNLAVHRPKWDIGLLTLVGGSALLAQGDWESFRAVCDWARENTDVDAVFVVPPARFSPFGCTANAA